MDCLKLVSVSSCLGPGGLAWSKEFSVCPEIWKRRWSGVREPSSARCCIGWGERALLCSLLSGVGWESPALLAAVWGGVREPHFAPAVWGGVREPCTVHCYRAQWGETALVTAVDHRLICLSWPWSPSKNVFLCISFLIWNIKNNNVKMFWEL